MFFLEEIILLKIRLLWQPDSETLASIPGGGLERTPQTVSGQPVGYLGSLLLLFSFVRDRLVAAIGLFQVVENPQSATDLANDRNNLLFSVSYDFGLLDFISIQRLVNSQFLLEANQVSIAGKFQKAITTIQLY